MVSSVLNWLSPIKEEVKGRSFNLTSGKIVSTQDTYKYHMQLQEEAAANFTRSAKTSTSSTQSTTEVRQGEGSTTAGQVKAQLISQTPPSTPTPGTGPSAGVQQQENAG